MKKLLCLLAVLCLAVTLCGAVLAEQETASVRAAAYPPTNVSVRSIATNQLEISWTAGVGATNYNIFRSTDESSWAQVEGGGGVSGTSFVDATNLTTGTEYYYRIQSVGGTDYSGKGSDGHYPHAKALLYKPTGLNFDSSTENSVSISWNEDPLVEKFEVWYGTTNACTSGPELTEKSFITIKGLSDTTTYYFKVFATVGANKSTESELLACCTTPKKPVGLKLTIGGSDTLTLTWTAAGSPKPDGYEVWRSDNGASFKRVKEITDGSASSYKDTGLTAGSTYTYKICAFKKDGTKTYKSEFSDTAASIPQAKAPANVKATNAGADSVKVTWDAVAGASGYYVKGKKSTDPDTAVVTMATITSGKTVSATVTDLVTGTEYTFYVSAFTTVGASPVEGILSASAKATPMPTAPKNLKVTSKNEQELSVSWEGSDGATSYKIYYSKDSTFPAGSTETFTVTEKSCTISGLTGGVTYYIRVVPYVKVNGVDTACASATGNAKPVPMTPTGFSVKQELSTSVRAKWSVVSFKTTNESGYQLEYREKGTNTWITAFTVADPSVYDYVLNGLSVGHTYQLRLRSYTYCGGVQVFGAWTTAATVTCAPLPPQKLVLTSPGLKKIEVTIAADTSVSGMQYYVYRSTASSGTYIQLGVATVSGVNELTFTDTKDLKKNTTYYYKVRCCVTIGGTKVWSGFSPVAHTTTKPAKPAGMAASQYDNGTAKISWKAVSGADGYVIYRSLKKTSGYSTLKTLTKGTSQYRDGKTDKEFYDDGVTKGKTYYYKVRSFITVNGKKIFSEYTTPVQVTIGDLKASAKGKAAAYATRRIRISWNTVSGAVSYKVYGSDTKSGYYSYIGDTTGTKLDVLKIDGKDLVWGKTYYFKLQVITATGPNALSACFSCAATPVIPINVTLTAAGPNGVEVNWVRSGGAQGYEVEYKGGSVKKWKTVTLKGATNVKTTIKGLTIGAEYSIRARSWRVVKGRKVYSPYKTLTYQN